jgi:hypothetical protein
VVQAELLLLTHLKVVEAVQRGRGELVEQAVHPQVQIQVVVAVLVQLLLLLAQSAAHHLFQTAVVVEHQQDKQAVLMARQL